MNDPSSMPWQAPDWNQRLSRAEQHRKEAYIMSTTVWTGYNHKSANKNRRFWSFLLFQAAASAMPELVSFALRYKPDPDRPLAAKWQGVDEGKLLTRYTPMAAFTWRDAGYPWPNSSVPIHTPLQAAIAGGSAECISEIVKAGGNLPKAMEWLAEVPLNALRIGASLTCLEVAANNPITPELHPFFLRCLYNAQTWLRRHGQHYKARPRIIGANRRMAIICRLTGQKHRLTSKMLAELL